MKAIKEFLKPNWWKAIIIISILLIIFFVIVRYQYNNCVKIEKEELKRCESGEFGDYDCSVFENAEELCGYKY